MFYLACLEFIAVVMNLVIELNEIYLHAII